MCWWCWLCWWCWCVAVLVVVAEYVLPSRLMFALAERRRGEGTRSSYRGNHELICFDDSVRADDKKLSVLWCLAVPDLFCNHYEYAYTMAINETIYILATESRLMFAAHARMPDNCWTYEKLPAPPKQCLFPGVVATDDEILVCGGSGGMHFGDSPSPSSHRYNIAARMWTTHKDRLVGRLRGQTLSFVRDLGSRSAATEDTVRGGHVVKKRRLNGQECGTSRLISTGGRDAVVTTADCFYRTYGSADAWDDWKRAPSLSVGRRFHTAAICDGQLIVAGGQNEKSERLETIEVLNLADPGAKWRPLVLPQLNGLDRRECMTQYSLLPATKGLLAMPYRLLAESHVPQTPVLEIDVRAETTTFQPALSVKGFNVDIDTLVSIPL